MGSFQEPRCAVGVLAGLWFAAQLVCLAAELPTMESISQTGFSAAELYNDDPTKDQYLPRNVPFVRVWQKSTDAPIPIVRVNCHDSIKGDSELVDMIKPGKKFELYPTNDSFTCTFVWMGTDRMAASQHFVVYSPAQNPDVLMLPFYCRICLWVFDHTGFDLWNNVTKSYVHSHNWLISSIA